MSAEEVLCRGTSLDGKPCTRHRSPGEETCRWHNPTAIEERAKAHEEQAARIRATGSVTVS